MNTAVKGFTKEELIEIVSEITGFSATYDIDEIEEELEENESYYISCLKLIELQKNSNNDYDFDFFSGRNSVDIEEAIEYIENAEENEFIHFHKDTKRNGMFGVDVWDFKTEEKLYELR